MSDASDERPALVAAGGQALRFNAPLSAVRAEDLVGFVATSNPASVVDLGCGNGALAAMIAERCPSADVVGVDRDADAIGRARARSALPRIRFDVGDASTWSARVSATVCIGGSHIFDGTSNMLGRLAELVPSGVAIVGDAFWQASPTPWCVETFGDLPVGLEAMTDAAVTAGWTVVNADVSTFAEWEEFESGWGKGVRSVGTEAANEFAAERWADYQRYRCILGFAWFCLVR